jgi:hypothetical protein
MYFHFPILPLVPFDCHEKPWKGKLLEFKFLYQAGIKLKQEFAELLTLSKASNLISAGTLAIQTEVFRGISSLPSGKCQHGVSDRPRKIP